MVGEMDEKLAEKDKVITKLISRVHEAKI